MIPNSAKVTGSDPAASIVVPSRRADSVTVTGRVIPFSVSAAAAVRVTVPPTENAAVSGTGPARVTVATGWAAVPRLSTSCGWRAFPSTVMASRLTRKIAWDT